MEWFIDYTDLDGIDACDLFHNEDDMNDRLQTLQGLNVSIWSYGKR